MFLKWKTKKLNFWGIQFLRYDVIKWRNNIKIFINLESSIKGFHMRYDTIWYRIVQSISKFDLGVSNFRPAARLIKVTTDQSQKLTSRLADHMLLSHQVSSWSDNSYSKIRVWLTPYIDHNMTLALKWCHHWVDSHWGTTIQEMLYRCKVYWMRKLSEQQWLHTKTNKHTE
jgi:hypothetical protein